MNNKKYILLVITSIIIVIAATISITFAYLSFNATQEYVNTLKTSCYNISFTDENSINITSYPMSSATAFEKITPYTFTISNNDCEIGSGYQIILNIKNNTSDTLLQYINYSLDGQTTNKLSDLTPTSLPAGATSTNTSTSFVLETGVLPNINSSKTYNLHLWIDESATEEIMGLAFTGEIMVYNTPMPAQIELTNLAADPSFESSSIWSGGVIDTAHVKYGSTSMKMTGVSGQAEKLANNTEPINLTKGHVYYYRYEVYHEGASGTAGLYWPIAEPSFSDGQSIGSANTWNIISARDDRSASNFNNGPNTFRIDYNNGGSATTIWIDGLIFIDLTDSFGAGNEPSKEWCDEFIPFFTGTTYIEDAS